MYLKELHVYIGSQENIACKFRTLDIECGFCLIRQVPAHEGRTNRKLTRAGLTRLGLTCKSPADTPPLQ